MKSLVMNVKNRLNQIYLKYILNFQETIWKKPRIYPMRNPIPPWLENVKVTPELIYRYQMNLRELGDILNTDLNSLKDINQVKHNIISDFKISIIPSNVSDNVTLKIGRIYTHWELQFIFLFFVA